MTPSWAATIRLGIRGSVNPKNDEEQKSRRFVSYLEWTKEFLQTHSKVPFDIAKKQHKELIGTIKPGVWSKFSLRVRKRLNLDTTIERKGKAKLIKLYAWVPTS